MTKIDYGLVSLVTFCILGYDILSDNVFPNGLIIAPRKHATYGFGVLELFEFKCVFFFQLHH